MSQLKQRVNFFHEEFKTPVIPLPAKQMLQITAIVLVGFVIIGAYQLWSLQALKAKIAKQENLRNQVQKQYEDLQASYVEPKEDPNLLKQLSNITKDAEQKRRLKRFLENQADKSLFSFSSVLDGLAESDVSNIWLTKVIVTTSGNHYELHGITQHAEAIPAYIEKLKQAKALQGTSFSVFSIERDEKRESILHFTLSSEQLDEQSEG